MQLAKVVGNLVSTHKNEKIRGKKILFVQPIDEKLIPFGDELIAIDGVGADTLDCNCQGELIAVVQNGSTDYEYLWNTGASESSINNLCAGYYSVTVVDLVATDTVYASLFLADSCLNIQLAITDSVTAWNCNGAAAAQGERRHAEIPEA